MITKLDRKAKLTEEECLLLEIVNKLLLDIRKKLGRASDKQLIDNAIEFVEKYPESTIELDTTISISFRYIGETDEYINCIKLGINDKCISIDAGGSGYDEAIGGDVISALTLSFEAGFYNKLNYDECIILENRLSQLLSLDYEIDIEDRHEEILHDQRSKLEERYNDELKKVTNDYGHVISNKVCTNVVEKLKNMKGMQLLVVEDAMIESVWDEICVQVQGEEFVTWLAYKFDAINLIKKELEVLRKVELNALWFSTLKFQELYDDIYWSYEEDGAFVDFEDIYLVDNDEICEHIFETYILSVAADEDNERLEEYLFKK